MLNSPAALHDRVGVNTQRSRMGVLVRAVLYSALAFWLLSADWVLGPALARAANALHMTGLSAGTVAFYATVNLLTAFLLTLIFGWYEGRKVDEYGLRFREAFGPRFWEGFALGAANVGAVAVGMLALGGMEVHGFAVHGSAIASAALVWLGSTILVGLAEEALFRGYLLQALWKGLGFWPAAILIALGFGADHYFFKPGENVWDLISLVSISLWLSYTVLRTGTLWLAVGYHAAFDYMQLFVVGTRNGSVVPLDRLLDTSFPGPPWLTGGVLGTEASFLMYPSLVLLFVYTSIRFRRGSRL